MDFISIAAQRAEEMRVNQPGLEDLEIANMSILPTGQVLYTLHYPIKSKSGAAIDEIVLSRLTAKQLTLIDKRISDNFFASGRIRAMYRSNIGDADFDQIDEYDAENIVEISEAMGKGPRQVLG